MAVLLLSFLAGFLAAAPAPAQLRGDSDCDGVLSERDLAALAQRLFVIRTCGDADPNRDGLATAADLPLEVTLILEALAPTPTPTPVRGPEITYFGLAAASGTVVSPSEFTDTGIPIFARHAGLGFIIVVEAAAGPSGSPVGQTLFNSEPGNATAVPDLQIIANRPLGDGSADVCDSNGGVPGINPPRFGPGMQIADALNDFACRFTAGTTRSSICTLDEFETANFAASRSEVQFCLQITGLVAFHPGDTLLTVRLRDRIGNLGSRTSLIIRVPGGVPTSTPTPSPRVPTPTPRPTRTPTRTPTATRAPTPPPTPAPATPTFTAGSPPPSATPTRSRPASTQTPTATPPPISSPSRTSTPQPTPTGPPASPTPSASPTPRATPTPTPVGGTGPLVSFIGVTMADDRLVPVDRFEDGIPVYKRPVGNGFHIVVEASRGPANQPLGLVTFDSDPADPTVLPDLQIQVNRPLGDGSLEVCDDTPPFLGGVPAVNPVDFSANQFAANAMNDLGCRFVDGTGEKMGRRLSEACVLFESGEQGFVDASTAVQFCSQAIPPALKFPPAATLVSARVRNRDGALSPIARMIVWVGD